MNKATAPDLPPQFQQPEGWQWGTFKNADGKELRFGYVAPEKPKAIVVGLHGLSEFCEKYFEIARDMLGRDLAFFTMDWQGQGLSERHLENPHKRYSNSFDEDIADLALLTDNHVRPFAAKHGDIPLVMLAHSMGGNIGLRYLAVHPGVFGCAAFTAPMLGIRALKAMPDIVADSLTGFFRMMFGTSYVFGGTDWHPGIRGEQTKDTLSRDPVRRDIQDKWCVVDPRLQLGHVTFGWLYEARRSCQIVAEQAQHIQTPCLFALAELEALVDNDVTRRLAGQMPDATLLEIEGAAHEILVERDYIRDIFLKAFDKLMAKSL